MVTSLTGKRPAAAPAKTPFRYGTRQRFAPVKTGIAFASGGRVSQDLPRVGFLSGVLARITGTMTLSAAGALGYRGPWDLIRELVVRVNIGASTIYRSTGYGNYVVQRLIEDVFDPAGAAFSGATDADVYSVPVAMGANTWTLMYWIPISANVGEQFHLGLVNLQAPEIQVNVDLTFDTLPDATICTNITSFAGNVDIGYLFYEVPPPSKVTWPPLLFYRTIESDQPIVGTGDQAFTFPREGIIHRVAHVVQINDARAASSAVSRFTLRANKTDELYRLDTQYQKWLQLFRYGPLPTGVYCHDFWAAQGAGAPGYGDNRDFISAEALSTLESIVTTSLATGGTVNRLDSIRQFIQVVAL